MEVMHRATYKGRDTELPCCLGLPLTISRCSPTWELSEASTLGVIDEITGRYD